MAEKEKELVKPVEATEESVINAEEIDQAIFKGENFIYNNRKSLLIVIGALVLLICGVIAYNMGYKAPRNQEASEAMFKAEQMFQLDSFNVALNGNKDVVGFLEIMDEYSGTDAANAAKAYAGTCYHKLGKNKEAIDLLKSFSGGQSVTAAAVNCEIATCYSELGENDKAVSYYKDAIDAKDKLVSPIALNHLGFEYLKQGNKTEAKKQFEAIKNLYPESVQAQEADKNAALCY